MSVKTERERKLISLAQQVFTEHRQLMLPHHTNTLEARLVLFDEVLTHPVNVTFVNRGRYRTNVILLTHHGQRPAVTAQQSHEDTIILDLSDQPEDLDALRHFLLYTEDHRYWHHAPWIVINRIKTYRPSPR